MLIEPKKRRRRRKTTTKVVHHRRKKKVVKKQKSGPSVFRSILTKGLHGTIKAYRDQKALDKKKAKLAQAKEKLRRTLTDRVKKAKRQHTFHLIKSFFKR